MRPLPLPPPPLPRSRSVAAAAVLGVAILGAILIALVPKFAEVFRQVRIAIPGSTLALMDLSQFLLANGWLTPLILIAVYDTLSRLPPRQAGIARIVIPILVVAALAWMSFALFQPLIGICEGIGRPR